METEVELSHRREWLGNELAVCERQRSDLETELGIDGATLDVEHCRSDLEAAERDREIKRRAQIVLERVRERMVAKVLPSTETNLRLLLPWLTVDRYRDARLDPNYRLEVWDERAGKYLARSIFSGGTKDQLSLGLRLAFALATLPQQLGTTPGFIFLDEPLSSFDLQRTKALVDLVTGDGLVARAFAQIFVISHSRSVDAGQFRYHLRLDGGRIVDSDLPPLRDAAVVLPSARDEPTGSLPLPR